MTVMGAIALQRSDFFTMLSAALHSEVFAGTIAKAASRLVYVHTNLPTTEAITYCLSPL